MTGHYLACDTFANEVANARYRRFPQSCGIDPLRSEISGDHLDRLVEHLLGLDARHLDNLTEKPVCAAAARSCDRFAVEPFDRFFRRFEFWRISPHHDDIAALSGGKSGRGYKFDRRLLGLCGRNHCGHITEITDLLLIGEHRVDDDCALKRTLKIDRAAWRQVLLPELKAANDYGRIGNRVIGLVSNCQMNGLRSSR